MLLRALWSPGPGSHPSQEHAQETLALGGLCSLPQIFPQETVGRPLGSLPPALLLTLVSTTESHVTLSESFKLPVRAPVPIAPGTRDQHTGCTFHLCQFCSAHAPPNIHLLGRLAALHPAQSDPHPLPGALCTHLPTPHSDSHLARTTCWASTSGSRGSYDHTCREGIHGGLSCKAGCLTTSLPCHSGTMVPSDARTRHQNQPRGSCYWNSHRQSSSRNHLGTKRHWSLTQTRLGMLPQEGCDTLLLGSPLPGDTASPLRPTLQGSDGQPREDMGCDVYGQKASASSPFSPAAVRICSPVTG